MCLSFASGTTRTSTTSPSPCPCSIQSRLTTILPSSLTNGYIRRLASRFRLNLQEIPNLTSFLELPPLPITTFNKIQSQVFQAVRLGVSDENVFVGAPTGSGETVCAELVLLRPILRHQGMVDMRVEEWRRKFSGLGKETVLRASDSQFSHRYVMSSFL